MSAQRRKAGAAGRPSLHGPKTEKLLLQLTPAHRRKAERDARVLGSSIADAIGSAIETFDAKAYPRRLGGE